MSQLFPIILKVLKRLQASTSAIWREVGNAREVWLLAPLASFKFHRTHVILSLSGRNTFTTEIPLSLIASRRFLFYNT